MQLLTTLSHMPFMVGNDLLFCHSDGAEIFSVEQTATAIAMGIPQQDVIYQPWRLARLSEGVIELFDTPGMVANSPGRVFCNPVAQDGILSFSHGGTLYTCPIGNGLELHPVAVKSNVFTGFSRNGQMAYVEQPSPNSPALVFLDQYGTTINIGATEIVRVVPSGPESLIITFSVAGAFRSILWTPRQIPQHITVNGGEDVYKCCIDSGNVIYAKRNLAGESYLHIDPVELTPYQP